jgi:hypothetical protein
VFSNLPIESRPGEPLTIGLTLVGDGIPWLLHFIAAFREMGRRGLRPGDHHFDLLEVNSLDGTRILDHAGRELLAQPAVDSLTLDGESTAGRPEALTVELVSPTRLVSDGNLVDRLEFQTLVRAALRRISALGRFHAGGEPDVDYRGLVEQAAGVKTLACDLHWADQRRYSCRQQRSMVLGGLLGTVQFEGPLAPFLPWLTIAERVHVGKNTSFGKGQIRVLRRS